GEEASLCASLHEAPAVPDLAAHFSTISSCGKNINPVLLLAHGASSNETTTHSDPCSARVVEIPYLTDFSALFFSHVRLTISRESGKITGCREIPTMSHPYFGKPQLLLAVPLEPEALEFVEEEESPPRWMLFMPGNLAKVEDHSTPITQVHPLLTDANSWMQDALMEADSPISFRFHRTPNVQECLRGCEQSPLMHLNKYDQ
ncbi:hypothetical protein HAX54_020980, partial [Datura stramonium]|nr:hypothetical protein [Datura stramonium]